MLTEDIDRYIAIRQAAGYEFRNGARQLHSYGRFADDRRDTHVRSSTALDWANLAPSPQSRHDRLRFVVRLARFLRAEDPTHEVPPPIVFSARQRRPLPYIYTSEEVAGIVMAAGRLRRTYPLRREVYATLFGLIASTGLRVSEALNLCSNDVLPGWVLHIRKTKFKKSRLVPLHVTAGEALGRYLELRRRVAAVEDHVFISANGTRIPYNTALRAFNRILALADIAPGRARCPRMHDLRHTLATRALEQCPGDRRAIGRHVVALSTYLGHVDTRATYWYLQATPDLMSGIASATEVLMWGARP